MEFGITFKGVVDPVNARKLVAQAEEAGFAYCWFFDSHILWRDSFPAMAMCMEHTKKMRFGPCVTNPNTREWSQAASLFGSMAKQSGGRFDIGVGRGDSAVRVMGRKPAKLAKMDEFIEVVKGLIRGEERQYGDVPNPIQFPWAEGYELPVWVAAYGPKALDSAGRMGDGLILQVAEPAICNWLAGQAIDAGKANGRDMLGYKVMADREDIPETLTSYIKDRKGYDYSKHGQSDNPYLDFITDDIIDAFAVLGSANDHVAKLKKLEAAGVTQFNIYLDNGDEENIIAEYGKTVIPALN